MAHERGYPRKGAKKIGEVPISETTTFNLKQKVRNPPGKFTPYYFTTVKKGLTYEDYCNLKFIQTLGEGEFLLQPNNTAIYSHTSKPILGGKVCMNIQVYNEGQFRTYKVTYIKSGVVKMIRERLY